MSKRGDTQKKKSSHTNRPPPWLDKFEYPSSLAGFDKKYMSQPKGAEDIDLENARKYRKVVNKKLPGKLTWLPKNQARYFYKIRKLEGNDARFQKIFNWYCDYLLRVPNTIPFYRPQTLYEKWDRVIGKYQHALIQIQHEEFNVQPTKTAIVIAQRLANRRWPESVKKKLPQIVQMGIDELTDFRKRLNKLQLDLVHTYKSLQAINKLEWAAKIKRNIIALDLLLENLPDTYNYIEQWYNHVWEFVSTLPDWKGRFGKLRFSVESDKFQSLCTTHCSRWEALRKMLDEN